MKAMVLLIFAIALAFVPARLARAQQIYLDANGDGVSTVADRMKPTGEMAVDLWIETDRNADGSSLDYPRLRGTTATINSYEFILRCLDGEVAWGKYTNLQPTMSVHLRQAESSSDYYDGYGGMEILPPGKYKLGTLQLQVKSGQPRLIFASGTPLWGPARTSFGSRLRGKDSDNTLKFTEDRKQLGVAPEDVPGDWSDARGLEADRVGTPMAMTLLATTPFKAFSVSIAPSPANPDAVVEVVTTRQGRLKVELFDQSGRLVRVLLRSESLSAGLHRVHLAPPGESVQLPSGVYLYRVVSSEGSATGKVIVLK